eukprot:XP_003188609.1 hypothetical protein ANI_1_2546024 [Aspergillus niger CBS 513.88]
MSNAEEIGGVEHRTAVSYPYTTENSVSHFCLKKGVAYCGPTTTITILSTYPKWVSSHITTITTIPLLPGLKALLLQALGPGTVLVARHLALPVLPLMIPEIPGLVLRLLDLLALMVLLPIRETPGVAPVVLPVVLPDLLLRDQETPGTVLVALLAALLDLLRQALETLGTAPVAPRDLPLLRDLEIPGIALVVLMVPLLLGPRGLGTALALPVLHLRDLLSTAGGK